MGMGFSLENYFMECYCVSSKKPIMCKKTKTQTERLVAAQREMSKSNQSVHGFWIAQ